MPIIRSSRLYLCYCCMWCVMPWLLVVGCWEQSSRLCVRDGGNCATAVSSSWWWAYKCPKHVEQIISAIKHSVASSWFSSLRLYWRSSLFFEGKLWWHWQRPPALSMSTWDTKWQKRSWAVTPRAPTFNTTINSALSQTAFLCFEWASKYWTVTCLKNCHWLDLYCFLP